MDSLWKSITLTQPGLIEQLSNNFGFNELSKGTIIPLFGKLKVHQVM